MSYTYFAEPIDMSPSRAIDVLSLRELLKDAKIPLYSPREAWSNLAPPFGASIQRTNNRALKGARVVLACLPSDVRTMGVPIELARASKAGAAIVVLSDARLSDSAALAALRISSRNWVDTPTKAVARVQQYMKPGIGFGDLVTEIGEAISDAFAPVRTIKEAKLQSVSLTDKPLHPDWTVQTVAAGGSPSLSVVETPQTYPEAPSVSTEGHGDVKEKLLAYWAQANDGLRPGQAPREGMEGDAGFDLYVSENYSLAPGQRGQVPCSIRIELPPGYWALIQGRSSSWNRGISVKASVIDNGYRGPLWIDCLNMTKEHIAVASGERLAQLILLPLPPAVQWLESFLTDSERGSRGYGSSGK